MDNVVNIHPPTVVDDILEALNCDAKKIDDLFVLRVSYTDDGERHLDWYTTNNSRIWSVGVLHFLAHKIMEHDE